MSRLTMYADSEIRDEYYERNLGGGAETWEEQKEMEKAYLLHHDGRKEEAYAVLWKMCLIKLNKVV